MPWIQEESQKCIFGHIRGKNWLTLEFKKAFYTILLPAKLVKSIDWEWAWASIRKRICNVKEFIFWMIVIKFDIVVMKMTVMTMMKLIRLNVSLFTTLLSDMDTSCLTAELTNQNMIGKENMISKYNTKVSWSCFEF